MTEKRNLWEEYHFEQERSHSDYIELLDALCQKMLSALIAFETGFRQFYPPLIQNIIEALVPFEDRFQTAWKEWKNVTYSEFPSPLKDFTSQLENAAGLVEKIFQAFSQAGESNNSFTGFLTAFHYHAKALETLYPFHQQARPVNRYFVEASLRSSIEKWEHSQPENSETGLMTIKNTMEGSDDHYLYVPEYYNSSKSMPMVIALHGGYGSGREFIWCWLREARSRGFIVLAPSSLGRTWDLEGSRDQESLSLLIEKIAGKYRVNLNQRLLTGFSDGATFSLQFGMNFSELVSNIAPISGVLHTDNLEAAKNKPVYLIHGSLDWMFPVNQAYRAKSLLESAGAKLVFKEIQNLSHTYPREENINILTWFDSSLSSYSNR